MSQNDEQKSWPGSDRQLAVEQDKQQRMMFKKLLRRKRRKEREAEGEIKELNITAMMDMMTIILVFLLKSYSATSINLASSGELAPPISTTRLAPKDTVAVTVTRCSHSNAVLGNSDCKEGSGSVMVMDKLILKYDNDRIPPEFKQGGKDGMLIVPLKDALVREVDRQKKIASFNRSVQLSGELSIIGDKRMPYRMLTEILYTAGQAELDNYRFVVIKTEGTAKTGG
jgi:biopolymer transport protein ExbD